MAPAVRSGSLDDAVTVLYVDESGPAETVGGRLERENDGLTVVSETSLDGAVERLGSETIDCVVWRHGTSDRDALEPLRIVRDRHGDLPFVLVTDDGGKGIAREAIAAGADEHLRGTASADRLPILANRIRTVVDRHRARTAATRAERRYRTLVDVDPAPIALFDADGTLMYINDSGVRLMNADGASELMGKEILEFVHPDDRAMVEERFERVVRESEALPETDIKLLTRDGRIRHVRGATAPGIYRGEPVAQVALDDVTDYEATRRELRAERRLTGDAIDALDDLFFVFNGEGRLLRWNDSVSAVTGYSAEEIGELALTELFAGDDVDRIAAAVGEAVDSGSTIVEAAVVTRRGESLPYEFRIERLDDGARFCGVGRDVTERAEREETFRALYQANRSLMTAESQETVCERAVATADRILGLSINTIWLYDEEAAVLRPVAQSPAADALIGEPPIYAGGESLSWRAFATNELQRYDDVRDAPDAYNRETRIRSELVLPLGDYGVMNVGSPDRHRFDELEIQLARMLAANVETGLERAEREALLKEERAFFEAVFNAIDDLFYIFGPENTPIRWNEMVRVVTGYTDEEIAEMGPLEFLEADDAERIGETLEELVGADNSRFEADLQTNDGETIPHQFAVTQLRDDETLIGIGGIGRDVTERKRRERELRRQNERLEEFASVVSHDLRNPTSVIVGRLELFYETRDDSHLEAIESVVDRIDELIDDLLTLARHGRIVSEPEWVTLADVVERAWTTVDTGETTLETAVDGRRIEADGSRLRELIENLVRNSVEHGSTGGRTEPGNSGESGPVTGRSTSEETDRGGSLTVRVGLIDDDGFYVEDTGPGIPLAEREAVFESGYSTKGDGSGLGLAITRRIAEAHGWSVRLVEGRDGGARFEFEGVTMV